MYGERVVITDVAAFEMIIGTFASVTTGATASAFGVSPKPARNCTLSRVISSCAKRLATSGAGPPVSRVISSIFLPATVSPCCFMYAFIPASICWPYAANGPENSAITPTFTGACACAATARPPARAAASRRND